MEKMIARCMRCKENKECEGEIVIADTKRGIKMKRFSGKCLTCGTKTSRILGKA